MNNEEKFLAFFVIVAVLLVGLVTGSLTERSSVYPLAWKDGFKYGILMYREADLDEDVNYVRWEKSRK